MHRHNRHGSYVTAEDVVGTSFARGTEEAKEVKKYYNIIVIIIIYTRSSNYDVMRGSDTMLLSTYQIMSMNA